MYLGAQLLNMTNVDGQQCWDMSYDNYCTAAVTNVKSVLENNGFSFLPKCVTPLSCCYHSGMYVTGYLKAYGVQWCQ